MAQIELENQMSQLAKSRAMLEQLDRVQVDRDNSSVGFGSLVITSQGCYLISVGLGRHAVEEQEYFIISSQSPIGALLMGKSAQDSVEFQGRSIQILSIS